MAKRETSDKLPKLAGKIMAKADPFAPFEGMAHVPLAELHAAFDTWVQSARSLAGSVLSQDEHKGPREEAEPQAGTSAYELVAAAEMANIEITDTLMSMTIATVLSILIDEEGGGRTNISISPLAMDEMHKRYEMTAKRDGLITTVRIIPRPGAFDSFAETAPPEPPAEAHLEAKPESLMTQDEPESAFEPQAEQHNYDRPLWAARVDGKLFPASGMAQAQTIVNHTETGQISQIENRYCYHPECPAECCTRPVNQSALEVTSE